MNTVVTAKGTELPLINLKGKGYLMVAHRLQWMNEEESNFHIESTILQITEEYTVTKVTVAIFDQNGKLKKQASATKRETKSDFSDHTEKSETGALGRALAMLGYGTQHAMADLDEGSRIVDSPMPNVNNGGAKRGSFKNSNQTTPPAQQNGTGEGWA